MFLLGDFFDRDNAVNYEHVYFKDTIDTSDLVKSKENSNFYVIDIERKLSFNPSMNRWERLVKK